ncbi:hypothetical protein HMP09_1928 [Sphingomonas sp. HMP9]|uniref:alpha-amylase family glycosyl hydrolase n=1 Tax=Sphingomonas sp. HMP9 TaxID=1517554 RepID=UPI001596D4C4|nr:alpha-amylase family glycosyl hydrolase [Sphingomonas sp. HMP9]BCA62694.1 hypothetical protein HMP09_1928 [Sphingomonas sp. HMP9]
MLSKIISIALGMALTTSLSAKSNTRPIAATSAYQGVQHPDWVKNAAIYELNLRQFSPEGTFAAAERGLPRLKALGIGIVWLMPIHPSGKVRAVPPLGSPYSVRDFRDLDPAYGSLDDLRRFTTTAHRLGMKVILDWVGNHSAWDNPLVAAHPDWFAHGPDGRLISPPWFNWGDVVQFDYRATGLRRYMKDSMAFWVRDAGVDGFRVDAAGLVPLDFWEKTRIALDRIKPVFMLAEWESRDLSFGAFDATYGWSWAKAIEAIAVGRGSVDELRAYYAWDAQFWPANAIRMLYVSNHDVIAGGTEFERFGPALNAAIALSIASEGMPLIFNGQEAGNRKRLKLFEHDPITWHEDPEGALYARLLAVRKQHKALWARPWGGRVTEVMNDAAHHVLSFSRSVDGDTVLAVFNLSKERRSPRLSLLTLPGGWHDAMGSSVIQGGGDETIDMPAWSYRLFVGVK